MSVLNYKIIEAKQSEKRADCPCDCADLKYIQNENPSEEWIVFLHGFGGSQRMWHRQECLNSKANLLIVDLPGHGNSVVKLDDLSSPTLAGVAKEICLLMDELGICKASFVSISLGSLVMAAVMRECPEKVDKCIVCGAIAQMDPLAAKVMNTGYKLRKFLPHRLHIEAFAFGMMATSSQNKSRKILARECRKMSRKDFLQWFGIMVNESNLLVDSIGLFEPSKTLFCMGEEDYVFIEGVRKLTQNGSVCIPLVEMAHCGHACTLQKWREFNVIADAFLTRGTIIGTTNFK